MPGEFTALKTRLETLHRELFEYLETIESSLTNDKQLHITTLTGLTNITVSYDQLISVIKQMTSN